jgi:hypothetical protein
MYLPRMSTPRAAFLVSAFFLLISSGLVSCGSDSGGGGKGGSGGAGGSTAGAGGSGTAGNGGPGTAGATGSAGNGGGSCQSCVSCVTTNCASQVATCMANSGCNMIYTCAKNCTTSIQTCITNNIAVAQMFVSSVYPCISSNCSTECTY